MVVTSRYDDGNGTILDYSSVYATSGTYACRIGKSNENMNCQVMWYTITKAICGISLVLVENKRNYLPFMHGVLRQKREIIQYFL